MPVHDWTRVEAGIFHHFHHCWIGAIGSALNKGILPPDYYALIEQIAGRKEMDVPTLQRTSPSRGQTQGGTDPQRVWVSRRTEEDIYARKQRTIVVRHITDDSAVARIEVLSSGNKRTRSALRSCLKTALSFLRDGCNLLLVDLFPPGRHDPQGIHDALLREFAEQSAFTLPSGKPLTLAAYKGGSENRYSVECIGVGDVLPDMPLFLDREHYVPVPLETTYRAAWEAVPHFWRDRLQQGAS